MGRVRSAAAGALTASGLLRLVVAALAILATVASPAAAATQHEYANLYSNWSLSAPGGIWNLDQNVQIRTKARWSYWPVVWKWGDDPSHGGYVGLQTDGERKDGTFGDTAIFSLWNANAFRGGAICTGFTNEGSGSSCRLAYTIRTDRLYRYRLWREEVDAGGQWWGAWIKDQSTGVEMSLGGLRVAPSHTTITNAQNFSEYFGDQVACNAVPLSVVDFTQPAANSRGAGTYDALGSFTDWNRGSCTGGSATLVNLGWTNAARVTLGGPK